MNTDMGQRKNPKLKIMQRSIGFNFYQMEFFAKYPDFQPDKYCRMAIDEQIKMINPEMIPEPDEEARQKEVKNEKTVK